MNNMNNSGDLGGGRDSVGGGQGQNPKRSGTMFEAKCADCGSKCEVPFKPSGDRPIYCSNCFGKRKGGGVPNNPQRRDFDRTDSRDKLMFAAMCSICNNKCEVPFKPAGDKPVYCNNCFGKPGARDGGRGGLDQQTKIQLDLMDAKLDKILRILNAVHPDALVSFKEMAKSVKTDVPLKTLVAAATVLEQIDNNKPAEKKAAVKKAVVKKSVTKKKK